MEVFQAKFIPKQAPPHSRHLFEGMTLKALVTSNPPLAQITAVSGDVVTFTVLLEVEPARRDDPWEVSLWYSTGGEWLNCPMRPKAFEGPAKLLSVQPHSPELLVPIYFTISLPTSASFIFTIKFRNGSDQAWKWVNEHQGMADGQILGQSLIEALSIEEDLGRYIKDFNKSFTVKKALSQAPGTSVWSLTAAIKAADGDKSAFEDIKLGLPWGGFRRWFSLVRIWTPWLAPRQGKDRFYLDKDGVMATFLAPSGKHMAILAISGVDDVMTVIQSANDGYVNLHVRNDSDKENTARVLVAIGNDFESANAAVMYQARNIIRGESQTIEEEKAQLQKTLDDVNAQWLENWFDGLTYCTWNGLGQRLTEKKIFQAVDTLAEHNINITNLIIDDNWQSIDYRGHGQFQHGWVEFEAEPTAFPNGLKHTVSHIRNKYKHVQHVAVWHAIMGYWGGLAPDGKIASTYKTVEVVREDAERRNLPLGGKMTVVNKDDVGKFYDDFYRFLSSAGIDSVKTDAQFILDTLVSAKDRRELINAYLDAWTVSSLRYFSIKAISCMSQTPQILFHSQMPQNRPAILVRNSDDFFPEIPESHPWHVFCNAHNSLFTQHLNLLPDWDMFQTVHDYSGFHAAARCVSGGPIYFTDVPGQHNIDLIGQMTAQTPRGKTVILRPSVVGKAIDQYNEYNDPVLLKIGTYHGNAITGTGILGIFNISNRPLTEFIPLDRFPGVIEAQYYVVRAHTTGAISPLQQVVDPYALTKVTLDTRGYEIFSSYPLRGFIGDGETEDTTWIANLGLLGKMTGAAAIVSSNLTLDEKGRIYLDTKLKALGVLGLYISELPHLSIDDDFLIIVLGQVIPRETVSVSKVDNHLLEIDLTQAWEKLGLSSGWSNEVEVKLYLTRKDSKFVSSK